MGGFRGNHGRQGNAAHATNVANERATAPYNFVSLPDKILPAELDAYHDALLGEDEAAIHSAFRSFLQEKGKLSGHIDLDIEALAPLFIGGNGVETFAPAGHAILPGSSIRGMVKNLIKIITCGSWHGDEDTNDRHIYYRCLMAPNGSPAWMVPLHNLYASKMNITLPNGQTGYRAKQGFLLKDKHGKYFVSPRTDSKESGRILIREYEKKFPDECPLLSRGSYVAWHGAKSYIITGSQPADKLVETQADYDALSPEAQQSSGKQHIRYFSLHDADWDVDHRIPVPDSVINDYVEDTKRNGVDLIEGKDKKTHETFYLTRDEARKRGAQIGDDIVSVIPCGYLEANGKVTAFGHGLCFRIPYDRDVMGAIPDTLKKDTIDFATALFGNTERWSSRLFFEDAEPVDGEVECYDTKWARPLLQPNPTSYQLYLTQDGRHPETPKHWDEAGGVKIRGYKLYWHTPISPWQIPKNETPNKNVSRQLTPIKRKSKFRSRIRFENLSAVELGALLMVFDLSGNGEKIAYKIGQAKSLGLGSIKIHSTFHLDQQDTYEQLFTDGRFQERKDKDDSSGYLAAFTTYVRDNGLERCWQETINEVVEMLDWDNAKKHGWPDKVASMSGNVQTGSVDDRFKHRSILPTVTEVYNG